MSKRILLVVLAAGLLTLNMAPARALSGAQFAMACDAYEGKCSDIPLIQAYVGGALDLVAMLDEETEYLDQLYCVDTAKLFAMPKIVEFMRKRASDHGQRNAMLLLIRYLEEHGSCAR